MDIKSHQRVNDILLGAIERPLLQWLAAKMPRWVTPDILTAVGVLGAVVIFAGYCLSNVSNHFLWLASFGFFLNWFGDSLDGTVARYRKIQRPKFGFFIDHTVDAFNEFLIAIGLGLSPYISFNIACLGLIGYLLLSVFVYVRTCVDGVFQISYGKIGPTEIRVIFILLNAVMYFLGKPEVSFPWGLTSIYDVMCGLLAAGLMLVFLVSTFKQAKKLAQLKE
ncbi:CDP-alcohol phosphatidyltransferase family protein [[Phormidium] sp. ETS-05]|uniref:CDP-alcohol phosphatidyltransferase family protein n=1 Tax=[Phormidium] sp. ETS-05 TaxID=222819 RepID=UPI0018EF1E3C|nr:CDP-alcohol phosphatidyltransferase family protein [[Phormidium] sp. ETS-05]